jgi:hypothetical protein
MATATGPVSDDEFVRGLPDARRRSLLASLLREEMRRQKDDGFVTLTAGDGQVYGHFVVASPDPPTFTIPAPTPESEEHMRRVLADPDNGRDAFELLDELNAQDRDSS